MNRHDDDAVLGDYQEQVSRPLSRLFGEYGLAEICWLAPRLVASIVTYAAALVTPIGLGTTVCPSYRSSPNSTVTSQRSGSRRYRIRLFNFTFAVLLHNLWRLIDFLVKVGTDHERRSPPIVTARTVGRSLREIG